MESERLPQSRSVRVIEPRLQAIVEKASQIIINYTLFENPFPASNPLRDRIYEAWTEAFKGTNQKFEECDNVCRQQVCNAPSTITTETPRLPDEW